MNFWPGVPPLDPQKLRFCIVCWTVAAFGPGWAWYGSLKGWDEGEDIFWVCSKRCQKLAGDLGKLRYLYLPWKLQHKWNMEWEGMLAGADRGAA